MSGQNIMMSFEEASDSSYHVEFDYDEILNKVNKQYEVIDNTSGYGEYEGMDDYIALELNYRDNFLKKDLDKIAIYYGISRRKKTKDELSQEIVFFEMDPANSYATEERKRMWFYIEQLKMNDNLNKIVKIVDLL